MMLEAVIAKLKTGRIVNVVEFGDTTLPSCPYVVVKQENDIQGRGTALRIIAHFKKGQQKALREYMRLDLWNLLNDFSDTGTNPNNLYYDDFGQMPEIIISNDDDSISMERLYWYPDKY